MLERRNEPKYFRLLTPLWETRSWFRKLVKKAELIHIFPVGTRLFTTLVFDWDKCDWVRGEVGPLRWPVAIWKITNEI